MYAILVCLLNCMDLVPDCTMNPFFPADLCPGEGLDISQTPRVLDFKHFRFSFRLRFLSAPDNSIRHAVVAERECICFSELHLCDSVQKLAAGVDDSRWWKTASRLKQDFVLFIYFLSDRP